MLLPSPKRHSCPDGTLDPCHTPVAFRPLVLALLKDYADSRPICGPEIEALEGAGAAVLEKLPAKGAS